jgi:glucan-binding YG repeat protein
MKGKFLRHLFIFVFVGMMTFGGTNELKANAESNGWVNTNNSWHYYSGPSITTGWYQYNGSWYYLDDNGITKTGWIKSEGKWYYLDAYSGKMLTGWIEDKGKWYYFNSTGEMRIGWFKEKDNLYYLNDSGVMVKNCYIDSYYLGPTGAWER